jgi:hypothetical protein
MPLHKRINMKIKYSIRPALFEDIEDILKLNQDTWDISYKDYIPHHVVLVESATDNEV